MTPTQLRTLIAVAETGSVHRAAERLVVTNSAVSASMTALQESLRLRLMSKDGRGIKLTKAGEVYLDYAYRVLGLLDEARTAAAGESDPERGMVRIAAVTSAGEHVVPGLLSALSERYPELGVLLEVSNQQGVEALFDHHDVDLVIAGPPGPGATVHGLRPNQLVVVAPEKLAAQRGGEPVLPWLARQTWLLRERGSNTRASTQALLSGLEIAPRTLTMGSNGAVRQSVVVGLGVTLISRDAVAAELRAGSVVEVPTPATPMHRPWYLLAHRGRLPATPALLVACALETGTFELVDISARGGTVAERPARLA